MVVRDSMKIYSVGLVVVFFGSCFWLMETEDNIKKNEIGKDELEVVIAESLGFLKNQGSDFLTNPRCNFSCPMRMKL